MNTPLAVTEDLGAPRSLIESTYRQLRADIIEGLHLPGEKMRVEHLKKAYGVGAGTVREALALLVSDSLVVPQAQKGFRVAPMSLADIEDLTRVRALLECAALRDAIQYGDEAWQARVVTAYEQLSRAEERLAPKASTWFNEWEVCNHAFHEALMSACPSSWILRMQALLYQQAHRYRRLSAVSTPVPVTVHEEHRQIFEAAMSRDAVLADRLLTQHIQFALIAIKSQGVLK